MRLPTLAKRMQLLLLFSLFYPTFQQQSNEQQLHQRITAASTPSDNIYAHGFRYLGDTPYKHQSSSSALAATDQIATALRVQRDIAVNVTIDQLVHPAIDLSTSFFVQNFSTSKIAQVDTLLLMGYKRLVVDLYWDPLIADWQLCPFFMNLSSAISSSSVSVSNKNSISSASTDISVTATATASGDTDILVLKDGTVCNYEHSKFRDLMVIIDNYLYSTEEGRASQKTDIVSIILNLHEYTEAHVTVNNNGSISMAAAILDGRRSNLSNANTSNITGTQNSTVRAAISLPVRGALTEETVVVPIGDAHLHQIITDTVSLSSTHTSRIYTPRNLTQDRVQLRQTHNNTDQSTWWPDWINLIDRRVQIIFGFGTFDPPTSTSFKLSSSDNSTIFDAQTLNGLMNATNFNDTACLTTTSSMANNNLSWAFISDKSQPYTYTSAYNITQCGYSPYFTHDNYSNPNSSIYNPDDTAHLADNILSTIWSWDVNEPAVTLVQGDNIYHNNNKRCATMMKSTGRWRAMDCNDFYRVACKKMDTPHEWLIINDTVTYDHALNPDVCPQGYIFDVPRLPRDNTALRNALTKAPLNLKEDDKVWINLNLVYTMDDSCWVIGRYGSCWWLQDVGQRFTGLITTSIVSGLIILILVGFFIWVKCARLIRNRHSNARKAMVKKMLAKRDYVTVPA